MRFGFALRLNAIWPPPRHGMTWYEQQRAGLGQEFLDEFVVMKDRLSDTPLIWPIVHRSTHRALLNRFPFGVYFRMNGADVVIVAVMHGSCSPSRWHGRT